MKTITIRYGALMPLCAALLAFSGGYTSDFVEREGGKLPDKDPIENNYGMLRSNKSSNNEAYILLTEGAGSTTDNLYYQSTQPAFAALSLEVRIDPSLVDAYNEANRTEYTLLPEANCEFPDGKTLDVAQNEKRSAAKRLKLLAGELAPGEYLLPVTVAKTGETAEKLTTYYRVAIRARQVGDHELNTDKVFAVFYINTNTYDPRLVDDFFMKKDDGTNWVEVWYRTIGNIINLRTVTITNEMATGRAKLTLGSDMTYVLNHADKYIRPLQDKGRKVCLALEGGGKGLGFCNLTDTQIKDFAAQVKIVIEEYKLDGVNLWDRNSGYGKEGMPAMNTTSYPKLIVALRSALGETKLLTVTDHMEPTEYFWDTTATGGIEVGKYLDYAWSGYRATDEMIQIFDPWNPGVTTESGVELVSKDVHKPFAGLDPSKYGCINVPWYSGYAGPSSEQFMMPIFLWRQAEYKQSQIIAFEDLRTVLQDRFEGTWESSISDAYRLFCDDGVVEFHEDEWGVWAEEANYYSPEFSRLGFVNGNNTYGKWLKDW